MWEWISNFLKEVLGGLIGGLVSGGLITAIIEIIRLKRENEKFKKETTKFETRIIFARSGIHRWNPNVYSDKDEKLRIYDAGLNGKIEDWKFIIKIEIENLTDHDLLAHDIILDIPQPVRANPSIVNKKFFKNVPSRTITKYDLREKKMILDSDLPLVIPARSSTGIVIIGVYHYDYPVLVDKVPMISKLIITTDIPKIIQIEFIDQEIDNLPETAYSADGVLLWSPYMDKNGIEYLSY